MSPSPQKQTNNAKDGATPSGISAERVVVSGMSGLYPQSRNIKGFSDLLYNKVNPVTAGESRWTFKHPEVTNITGKVSDLDRFDAQFFKVHYRQANSMDPMSRKLLELAYEAIYDAGINPTVLDGKKIGVFIGSGLSETEKIGTYDLKTKDGLGITGASKTMFANRISYWLNIKGPSYTVDSACCGSMVALEQALLAINRGECEAAIVGSSNLCLCPQAMVNYSRCIAVARDGKTKSFAENADGCAKSDAINIIYLQKARDALRVYGEVVSVKNQFISRIAAETGQVFGFNRDLNSFTLFLKQFYEEANVSPETVEFVEAFGSASPEADKTELQAIEKVFCGNRTDTLLVGSVMSNIGYTDCASGITAMTKVLLGYHKGEIAGNLCCEKPRQDVGALRDGRMQVVRDNQSIRCTYTAVNGLSVTGVNSHILLQGRLKLKDYTRYKSTIPRLLTVSARQDSTLYKIFDDFKSRPIDPEELALLHNIHANNIPGHLGRGYTILDMDDEHKTRSIVEKAEYRDDAQRPLWFVYSGMGSQWPGMGAQLMRIPIFAAAIERCRKVLQSKGIDVVNIITSRNKATLDNILNSLVGIAAIQIGLTDILKELGLKPDKIIGHSTGELGCAYADGCLTAEEMILAAYSRGRVSLDTQLIRGAMAAVGLGYKNCSILCPPEIDVACHNGLESCTISGPADKITEFVAKLKADGVFSKEVPCSNIAYHSRYITAAGPKLLEYLTDVVRDPKPRSDRWLSTSVPEEKWNEPRAKLCSADYLTNNLLSPVLFEETSRLVPSNAVLVEIAPHGLLQAILKRSLPESCKNIALTKRGHADNAVFLLDAIGQLYIEGFTPRVQALYPQVEFPVSTGTPHLSHHVEWMHSEHWDVIKHVNASVKKSSSCDFLINLHEDEHIYLKGNIVRGKVVYPFSAALVAAWDTLAMTLGERKKDVSVQFRDVHLYSQPIMHDQRQLKLNVSLHRGNGQFHILDDCSKVASGFISRFDPKTSNEASKQSNKQLKIGSEEVYQHLSSQGYDYRHEFKSIYSVNENMNKAKLLWNENWSILIDSMVQLNVLKRSHLGIIAQPSLIRELSIDVEKHYKSYDELTDGTRVIEAKVDPLFDKTSCGGIVLRNIKFRNIVTGTPSKIALELAVASTSDNVVVNEKTINNNKLISTSTERKSLALKVGRVGELNTLHWQGAAYKSVTGLKIKVQYAGVNVADINKAAGVIPFADDENYFGMDFSGLAESGERVMGFVKNGAISTVITAQPDMMWPVPAHWSLEDAATVPLAYVQAFYCLKIKNKLGRNTKVLIHGGAGALGQAAISIALAMGCQVFTTVADQSKKLFLKKLFPRLRDEYIGNSRDCSFGDIVLNATNSEGCDIVLSCVKGDLRNVCLKVTAHMGTTIDTSLLQSREDYVYGMSYMTKSRSFMAVDFNSLFDSKSSEDMKNLRTLVSEGIAGGYVRPLSRVTYGPDDAPRAFRLLAASRHRGRVLLRLSDPQPQVQSRINCRPNRYHIIFCDGNVVGLQFVDTLVARGAKSLRIHYLNQSSHQNHKIRLWKNLGVKVEASFGKLFTYEEIFTLLNMANESKPVEGIYVLATDKNSNNMELTSIVNLIDAASRVVCPLLRYFTVVSIEKNIGARACLSRSFDREPAIALSLPDIKKLNEEHHLMIDDFTWNQLAVDVIERALNCNHPILTVKPQLLQHSSLLQQLVHVTGLQNIYDCKGDTTLKDLRVENEVLYIIKSYLNDTVNVTLEIEDILELTKNKINQIELNANGEDFKDVKGLKTYFSYVDSDELRGTTDLMLLDTLVNLVIGDELDLTDSYLSIVPGMEGHHERFRLMCASLKLPAVVLQPGLDFLNETPEELALRYSKVLIKKLGVKDSFYLLGYECGVTVALELSAILEQHGKTGTVFCIGDGLNVIRAQVEEQLADFLTEEALQSGIIAHMFGLMSVEDTELIESVMKSCSSWEQRVEACLSALLGRVSHSAQYVRAVLEAAYARINTARTYHPRPHKLQSKIVLMRTKSSFTSSNDVTLQQFSEQPVDVHELAAPLAYATKDLRCASIINRYLPEDLLKTYENCNLCIPYAVDN